jgi:hypothetical protein
MYWQGIVSFIKEEKYDKRISFNISSTAARYVIQLLFVSTRLYCDTIISCHKFKNQMFLTLHTQQTYFPPFTLFEEESVIVLL